ncbi:MAG: ABC transporter substrate-binding protein [Candidatus Bathyarchaeia archaeon]
MNHKITALAPAAFLLLVSIIEPINISYAQTPNNQYELIVDVPLGYHPVTFDPANCYDMASAELLFNVYETLITFDGERYDCFLPHLATQVVVAPPDPAAPAYTNFTVYFEVRVGVPFHTWCRSDLGTITFTQYYLTTADVEHSFERWMVLDYVGGPQWMIYEPLLNTYGADPTWPSDPSNPINQAVQSNSTHVWLNIANQGLTPGGPVSFAPVKLFDDNPSSYWYGRTRQAFWDDVGVLPLGYPLRIFFQVVSQFWASIMSKSWLLDYVGPEAQLADPTHPGEWDGNWATWLNYWNPDVGQNPAVDIVPGAAADPGVTCGTGPYILDRLQWAYGWSLVKYDNYWRGWPADWPSPPYPPEISSSIRPAGWIERLTVRQVSTSTGIAEFLAGVADFAAVPRARCGELHVNGDKYGPTREGIRLDYPIPSLSIDSFHMTFDVEPTPDNRYGEIYDYDVLNPNGIPRNFFGNVNVRKAFAHLINFTMILQDQLLGEAYQPNTFAPGGFPYIDASIPKYYYDESLAASYFAAASFNGVPLTSVGFTVYICFNSGNTIRQAIATQLATSINKVASDHGWPFTAYTAGPPWSAYLTDMDAHMLPAFVMDWQADYVDIHSYAYPYAHSQGALAAAQRYSNPTVDALIEQGLYTPDGPVRQAIYYQVENIFFQEAPTIPLYVAIERGYMRDWVQGHYYNPLAPGIYSYDMWKWPMTDTPGAEGYWPGDVNYDGIVDTLDVLIIRMAYGSFAGKVGMPISSPRWNFHCDIAGPRYGWHDRKIDSSDIASVLLNFGKFSQIWIPPIMGSVLLENKKSTKYRDGDLSVGNKDISVNYASNPESDTLVMEFHVVNVTDIIAWQIRISWNNSIINYAGCIIPSEENIFKGKDPAGPLQYLEVDGISNIGTLMCGTFESTFEGVNVTGWGLLCRINFTVIGHTQQKQNPVEFIIYEYYPSLLTTYIIKKAPLWKRQATFLSRLVGDVDCDGKVKMDDVISVCDAFGSTLGTDGNFWHQNPCPPGCPHSPGCNLYWDNKIDMGDVIVACDNFGKTYP